MNSSAPEEWTVPAPLMDPVVFDIVCCKNKCDLADLDNMFILWNICLSTREKNYGKKIANNIWFICFRILEENNGMPPLTYNIFTLVAATIGDPPRPVSFPEFNGVRLPVYPDHDRKFGIPTPQTLGKHVIFLELHNLAVV